MPQQSSALAITEENNHARHIFTSAVGWFSLFTTANYLTFGWMVSEDSTNRLYVIAAAILFVFQNAIGLRAMLDTKKYFKEPKTRISEYHDIHCSQHGRTDPADYYPKWLYLKMINLMSAAMLVIMMAWFFILLAFCFDWQL